MKNKMHLISFSYLFLLFFTTLPKQAHSFQKNNLENKSNYLISNVSIEDKLIKTVTANGFGTSIESAARNAASNGLTQIVGSFIDAETIIKEKTKINNGILEQANIIKEEISDYSQGSIKYFEILNIEKNGSIYNVTARVDVRVDDFKKYIKAVANNISRISTIELFAEMGTNQNNLDNKYKLFKKIFSPLVSAEVMETSNGQMQTLESFITSEECKKTSMYKINKYWCGTNKSNFAYHLTTEKSVILPFSIRLNQNYIDNTLDVLDNISDSKFVSTFTYNAYNPVVNKIYQNLFDRNVGITINKRNSKMTTTKGFILEDIKKRNQDDKIFWKTIPNLYPYQLSRRLVINFLDAEGNILYFFKEGDQSKCASAIYDNEYNKPAKLSGSSKNLILLIDQHAWAVSGCAGQMYSFQNYIYKITTQRDYYFAFEVNDLDKFNKIDKMQITYE